MSDLDALLLEFIEADLAGNQPDPVPFLERTDDDEERLELVELIDAYLDEAPVSFDPDTFSGSQAELTAERFYRSLAGVSGRWPTVLPALRERARVKRGELAERLSEALGVPGETERVAEYFHAMEQGSLPAEGVSEKVIDGLAAILGIDAETLRSFGSARSAGLTGGAPSAVFTRKASSHGAQSPGTGAARPARATGESAPPPSDQSSPETESPGPAAGPADRDQWDDLDRLFLGG